MKQTVYIVDDDAFFRHAISELLNNAGHAVEDFSDGPEFLSACSNSLSGCVILDEAMPLMKGHEVFDAMKEKGLQIPVIFLTGHGDISMAVRSLRAGALDFLEKPIEGDRLLNSVERALKLDESNQQTQNLRQEIIDRANRLSTREFEVMRLVVSGLSNKAMAKELGISPRTVETHRAHVMFKMGAKNLSELIHFSNLLR
jgi:two-component system response regulator FixJ